ncbi:MAG: ATP-binding protein [Pseudomonadota bacterium]
MSALKIAILGAESTGKTTLARALAERLRARSSQVALVSEVLREWCAREGRAPRPEENLAIAREHERRVDEAAAQADIVIADTTALMVAIWGGLLFTDDPLWRFALERQRGYALNLVTGLDLPWVADGLQRQGPPGREPADALVREGLEKASVAWRVVYGSGEERLCNALEAVAEVAPWAWTAQAQATPRWRGLCDACSDPECEHRLFKGLMGR